MRKVSATSLIAAAIAVLGLYALTTTNSAAETPPPVATYATLSPVGQSIARALHRAQLFADGSGGMSLDRIAAIKSVVPGWGPVA